MKLYKIFLFGLLFLSSISAFADQIIHHDGYIEILKTSEAHILHYYPNSHEVEEVHMTRLGPKYNFDITLQINLKTGGKGYRELRQGKASALIQSEFTLKETSTSIFYIKYTRAPEGRGTPYAYIRELFETIRGLNLPGNLFQALYIYGRGAAIDLPNMRKIVADFIEKYEFHPFETSSLDIFLRGASESDFADFRTQLLNLINEGIPGEERVSIQTAAEIMEASCKETPENYKYCLDFTVALHKFIISSSDEVGQKSHNWLAHHAIKLLSGGKKTQEMIQRLNPEISVSDLDLNAEERRKVMQAYFIHAFAAGNFHDSKLIPEMASRFAQCSNESGFSKIDFEESTLIQIYRRLIRESEINAKLRNDFEKATSLKVSPVATAVACEAGARTEYTANVECLVNLLDSLRTLAQERTELQTQLDESQKQTHKRTRGPLDQDPNPTKAIRETSKEK